ncbi:cbb3-type cytochrome c oxidase N-terminal domain-containing protein [Mariniblastus fucicola]|uniref:Cbb3-type cytochrome c oxidase subunit CcoP n=1 Tax=Mariniblastus fucicola TaxID=980251 RepID=A0A5B9P4H0_9BACT|nr:cbb3-type cytochrome c oxidase N-terminal domain-containing protein [Mariniblastus fucicola]QEG20419.1 Cbb3-type cytochrome c oxidase subunit CcoP [Mariniblastus fucicola]
MSTETAIESTANQNEAAEDILTDHSYDGIQEYDNPLPGWWMFLFWVSIFFSPVYYFWAHSGAEGRSIHDQYDNHMAAVFEQRFAKIGELTADRETIMFYMNEDPEWLAVGKVVYQANCVSCHGADGGGVVGPNLTDDHWKHVRNVEDIARVIEDGAANGAMPAWKTRLSHPNQIVLTAAYVASLRENPVAGKAAEGNKVEPWTK